MFTFSVESWMMLLLSFGCNIDFCPREVQSPFSRLRKNIKLLNFTIFDTWTSEYFFYCFFVLKADIGCSWNSFSRFLLVWKMFQIFQTASARFGKNQWYVNNNGMRFASCCSQPFFFCRRRFLTGFLLFHFFLFMVVT